MAGLLFLPGAGGRRQYWRSVASLLPERRCQLLAWPGFGDEPRDGSLTALSDLAGYVLKRLETPATLVAQSMGGVVALTLALRAPHMVERLVLAGTSGGIDLSRFDATDWRADYLRDLPEQAPRWFVDDRSNLEAELHCIDAPALLLWGEQDTISPPAVGRYLHGLLPRSRFVTVPGAGHMLAEDAPESVAQHIRSFLEGGP